MFLFPILLAVLIYYLFSGRSMTRPVFTRNEEALEALKLRYVNGEIDDETYIKMKATLNR